MAKCYNFYGIFVNKTFTKKSREIFCKKYKCKTSSKVLFAVVVHGGILREKKIIESKMRKGFYEKIFFPKEKKNSSLSLA